MRLEKQYDTKPLFVNDNIICDPNLMLVKAGLCTSGWLLDLDEFGFESKLPINKEGGGKLLDRFA